MRQFWWVNHKQTFKQESEGKYIWSPKRNIRGNKSAFYDNMQKAQPGDWIISYANTTISLIGVIEDYASSLPKPKDFLSVGDNWSDIGWYVPVTWVAVDEPLWVKGEILEIRHLFPKKYSPMRGTGDGNEGAYLCQINEELFNKILELTKFDALEMPVEGETRVIKSATSVYEDELEEDIKSTDISETEKPAETNARRGQGKFKKNVCAIEDQCRVTGVRGLRFLIASHIRPWSLCETGTQRLDGNNGLLLAPHIDKLFNDGYISFTQDGQVLRSPQLGDEIISAFGLTKALVDGVGSFTDKQELYLAFHREIMFKRAI